MSVMWYLQFYSLTGQGTIMQPEPFSRLQPFRSHLLFNLPETYFFFFKIDYSKSFNFHEKIEYRRLFFPKTQVFQKM